MRANLSTFLLKTLLWMLCTHSLSYASILTSASLSSLIEASLVPPRPQAEPARVEMVLKRLRQASNQSVSWGDGAISRMGTLEANIGSSGVHVLKNSPAHGQLIENKVDSAGFEQVLYALIAAKAGQNLVSNQCLRSVESIVRRVAIH